MSYQYSAQKPKILTDEGQRAFLAVRDRVAAALEVAGCVRMDHALAGTWLDSWGQMACVDRMVELGELAEVIPPSPLAGQYRIFTRWPRD